MYIGLPDSGKYARILPSSQAEEEDVQLSSIIHFTKQLLLTSYDGLSVRSDGDRMAYHVGVGKSEQLFARLSVPHPHVVMATGGVQLR